MPVTLRLVYLIFVHKDPESLVRLLEKLYTPITKFYIYVDAKVDILRFKSATTKISSENIVWLKNRKKINWGDFTLCDAYLSSYQTILEECAEVDFILTISGQDYPIATNQTINKWLSAHLDYSIMDYTCITDTPHIMERVEKYYLSVNRNHVITYPYPNPNTFKKKIFNVVLRLSGRYKMPRTIPLDHQLYFGTNWFQLKPKAAKFLIEFSRFNPEYVNFFRSTYVPEELFFQTVLLNASESERGKIFNYRMTYMQWDRPEGSYTLPIEMNELANMLESNKFFARKFEQKDGDKVINAIDEYLMLNKQETLT